MEGSFKCGNEPLGSIKSREYFDYVKLATHLHLAPRLRMRGAIPLLPQYVFMEWC
jgi:hypothetical protein